MGIYQINFHKLGRYCIIHLKIGDYKLMWERTWEYFFEKFFIELVLRWIMLITLEHQTNIISFQIFFCKNISNVLYHSLEVYERMIKYRGITKNHSLIDFFGISFTPQKLHMSLHLLIWIFYEIFEISNLNLEQTTPMSDFTLALIEAVQKSI